RVEQVGVAVAHHAEDVVDVSGECGGDVGGDAGHGGAFRDDGVRFRMCLAPAALRAPFPSTGGRTAGQHEYRTPRSVGGAGDDGGMDVTALRAQRLRSHRLSAPAASVADAAAHLLATQAQEFWGGRWALALRSRG